MLSIWSTVLFWSLGSAYHLWSPSQCSYPAPSGGWMPPRTGAEKSQVLSAISQKFPFNIQVFVSSGKWSSDCPPKCPSECLPRITHVPENGFSLMHPAASWSSLMAASLTPLYLLPDLRPVPCSAAGMGGEPDSMTFLVGRVTSEFGHCWKESPIVWHANHDAIYLAPLNIDLLGDSSQESSLFKMSFLIGVFCKILETEEIRLIL